ncbi:fungal-specific transcription factor domain-containing protein [Tricladium varicosporioides]|nr:fungal-specific transcription factor domain-containing protein [Hymenoscyphus varicosporioides]
MEHHEEEFDLSALILHNNASSPFFGSPSASPAPEPLPQVVPRPISKRRGKKRSSRACTTCRQRKVRCNIVAHGAPCSNCRHDEIECILPLSRRQRSARERAEREQSLRDSACGSEAGDKLKTRIDTDNCATKHTHIHNHIAKAPPSVSNLAPHGMSLSEYALAEILPTTSITPAQTEETPQPTSSSRTKSWIQIQSPLASAPIPLVSSGPAPDQRLPILPKVFSPFPRHLDAPDLLYLHSRDALTLPSETLQIHLLKAYIDCVNGTTPILDLEEFLSAVKYGYEGLSDQKGKGVERETAGRKQISFLLFQAAMFAAVEYVGMKALRDAGYASRDAAKRVFFSRAKLLYDFDTTTDRLSIIQSLLLLTLYPSTPTTATLPGTKDNTHYLNLAISLSYSLGLHRNASLHQNIRKRKLERRIFWAAFTRDRMLSLQPSSSTRTPFRIKREDCDIEMLKLEDFEFSDDDEGGVRDRVNAQACVERALLCWCVDDTGRFAAVPSPPQFPPSIFIPQNLPMVEEQQPLYTSTTTTSHFEFQPPMELDMEEQDYAITISNTASTPSLHSSSEDQDIPTPRAQEAEQKVICSSPLGAGFGVDGEYDDYLEFLRPSIEVDIQDAKFKTRERQFEKIRDDRSTWAFQLDCDNDVVLKV